MGQNTNILALILLNQKQWLNKRAGMLILTEFIDKIFRSSFMTLALLDKLESKIQNAVDTISLLQMEVEELNSDKIVLSEKFEQLQSENTKLAEEHQQWQSRLSVLVGKIEEAEDKM